MKITALKQQLKNTERISVFLDGKYTFSLSLDELAKYKLKNSDELSSADVKKYKKISEDGKLRARALEWLLNRPHSERELRDYLYKKKADPSLSEELVNDFKDKNYLNDASYSRWLFDLRSRAGKSNRAIRSELLSKGVGREVIEEILEGQAENEAERLRVLINKKQNLTRYKNDRLKFIKYLTSQGFSYSLVKSELNISATEN